MWNGKQIKMNNRRVFVGYNEDDESGILFKSLVPAEKRKDRVQVIKFRISDAALMCLAELSIDELERKGLIDTGHRPISP